MIARWAPRATLPLLLLLVVVAAMSPLVTSAQGDGVVEGTVTNGSTGQPVAGATVTLSKFTDQTGTNRTDVTTTTDDAGHYRFEGQDTASGLAYLVSVVYEGVPYTSSMVLLSRQAQQTVDLIVYEPTHDQTILHVAARGLIVTGVDPQLGQVTMTDIFSLLVDGDRALVAGDDGRTARFSVPPNALEVTPRPGFDFGSATLEGTTVFATAPLPPGTSNASLDYLLPYAGTGIDVTLRADYATDEVRVLVPVNLAGATILASGAGLTDAGVVMIEGRDYHLWVADALAAGETLDVHFSGLPRAETAERQLRTLEPAILAAVALAGASGVAAWAVRRRRVAAPVVAGIAALPVEELAAERARLADALRSLEAERAAGAIDDDTYEGDRRAILEDLRVISRRMRGLDPAE